MTREKMKRRGTEMKMALRRQQLETRRPREATKRRGSESHSE